VGRGYWSNFFCYCQEHVNGDSGNKNIFNFFKERICTRKMFFSLFTATHTSYKMHENWRVSVIRAIRRCVQRNSAFCALLLTALMLLIRHGGASEAWSVVRITEEHLHKATHNTQLGLCIASIATFCRSECELKKAPLVCLVKHGRQVNLFLWQTPR